ncbi:MAG: 2-hydroxyacid dehydrogenase [Nocardioidaceae bacterium]
MSRPVVLLPGPLNSVVLTGCAALFDVLRLWEEDEPEAVLDARGAEVLGIATMGHRPVDADLMDRLPRLQVVACFGVGYETVDVEEATRRGVVVTNTPGVLDAEVADTALALLLMTVRELSQAERHLRSGRWPEGAYPLTEATMSGRSLGILGLGRIGDAIARRAEAFGMTVAYHNRRPKVDVGYRYYATLLELARAVDTLVVVVPGGQETRHLVDAEVLEALGEGGILVNVGRGSVVDENALADALEAGTIRGAGLDVFEHEPHVPQRLLDLEQAVLLPHVGSASVPTRDAMGQLVVDNLAAWFDTGKALTPVNNP